MITRTSAVEQIIDHAQEAIGSLRGETVTLQRWAALLYECLQAGGLVMAAGNGGSATHADHLTGELIGRFRHERRPLRAVSLNADPCALTAIGNDYGFEEVFARQVRGLARRGDVVVLFSTSGRSPNVVAAAIAARANGATALALTGPVPNPLAAAADETIGVRAPDTASVQDAHHVAVHALCAALDELVGATAPASALEAE
jgi:D-sedoheptulose 7-phosphate isomerase